MTRLFISNFSTSALLKLVKLSIPISLLSFVVILSSLTSVAEAQDAGSPDGTSLAQIEITTPDRQEDLSIPYTMTDANGVVFNSGTIEVGDPFNFGNARGYSGQFEVRQDEHPDPYVFEIVIPNGWHTSNSIESYCGFNDAKVGTIEGDNPGDLNRFTGIEWVEHDATYCQWFLERYEMPMEETLTNNMLILQELLSQMESEMYLMEQQMYDYQSQVSTLDNELLMCVDSLRIVSEDTTPNTQTATLLNSLIADIQTVIDQLNTPP